MTLRRFQKSSSMHAVSGPGVTWIMTCKPSLLLLLTIICSGADGETWFISGKECLIRTRYG